MWLSSPFNLFLLNNVFFTSQPLLRINSSWKENKNRLRKKLQKIRLEVTSRVYLILLPTSPQAMPDRRVPQTEIPQPFTACATVCLWSHYVIPNFQHKSSLLQLKPVISCSINRTWREQFPPSFKWFRLLCFSLIFSFLYLTIPIS